MERARWIEVCHLSVNKPKNKIVWEILCVVRVDWRCLLDKHKNRHMHINSFVRSFVCLSVLAAIFQWEFSIKTAIAVRTNPFEFIHNLYGLFLVANRTQNETEQNPTETEQINGMKWIMHAMHDRIKTTGCLAFRNAFRLLVVGFFCCN